MKFYVEKKPLTTALARLARVVERRTTYPILSNVRVSATAENIVELRATDLDIEVTERIPARVEDHGTTTVPAHLWHDMIRKAGDGAEIQFELVDGDQARVKYGRSRFHLGTLDPESFPDLKSGEFTHTFTMAPTDLSRLLSKTAFAISTEETRYYLNGVYLHGATDEAGSQILRAVATDGHRMARCECPCPAGAESLPGIIIPKKTVGEVQKLIDGADGEVSVSVSDSKISVEAGSVVLLSKLIEAQFPDYQRVEPKQSNTVATVDISQMKAGIDRVATIATERGGKAVKLSFNGDQLGMEVTNPDHGSSSEDMAVEWGGEPIEIGFNAKYLLDVLGNISGSTALISLTEPGAPTRITSPDDPSVVMTQMPMRV